MTPMAALKSELTNLFTAVKKGVPVLTSNKRLSRYIISEYNSFMMSISETVWPTPVVLPMKTWLELQWEEAPDAKPVLSELRAHFLWENILSDHPYIRSMDPLSAPGVYMSAYEAYKLIRTYLVDLPGDIYLSEDGIALKQWITSYENAVDALGFIEANRVADELFSLYCKGGIEPPDCIILAGFDDIPPQIMRLMDVIQKKGASISRFPALLTEKVKDSSDISIDKSPSICVYENIKDEIAHAARWVRKTLRTGETIGIVAPELQRYKNSIIREFSAELDPVSIYPWAAQKDIINLSLGNPLYQEPVIRTAIDLLEMNDLKQYYPALGYLLMSPYFSTSGDEYMAISDLDLYLRKNNYFKISLLDLREITKSLPADLFSRLANFRNRLDDWLNELKEDKKYMLPGEWAERFQALLKTLGWPAAALNSNEHQACMAWNRLLSDMSSLDDISGRINRNTAVMHIKKIALFTIHQPETENVPVQVLGTLEAAGMHFDHLWIIGADNMSLPPEPSPNPFLPYFLQKKYSLPHSSPEKELAYSTHIISRLLNSSPDIVISYSEKVDDREVKLSTIFHELSNPDRQYEEVSSVHNKVSADHNNGLSPEYTSCIFPGNRIRDILSSMNLLEDSPLENAIPLADDEKDFIKSGADIIKDQSQCPFRAFAIHRLHSMPVPETSRELSALDRGVIMHKAMKLIWQHLRDSRGLHNAITGNQLEDIIKASADDALIKYYKRNLLPLKYLEIEKERIITILTEWFIQMESVRADFHVEGLEIEKEIELCGLKLHLRVDRIDKMADGRGILIDYKTGQAKRELWLTKRPADPQLMIYRQTGNYDAVCFATLRPGESSFTGIAKESGILPGITSYADDHFKDKAGSENWDHLMNEWKTTVEGLAADFIMGKMDIDPADEISGARPCEYCRQRVLCGLTENRP